MQRSPSSLLDASAGSALETPPLRAVDFAQRFLHPWRPWLGLYAGRVRAGELVAKCAAWASGSDPVERPAEPPAPILAMLNEELLCEVLKFVEGADVARCASVCREWRYATLRPALWRYLCADTWSMESAEQLEAECCRRYRASFREMYLTRPRLRFDGIYVSRNQYLRRGVREWAYKGGVHVVVYYRYYRFFRDGTFVYKNSASNAKTVKNELARPIAIARDVAPTAGGGRRHRKKQSTIGQSVFGGVFHFDEEKSKLKLSITYPGERPTVCRQRLRLRSTVRGANNRLDFLKIVTSGADEGDSSDDELVEAADAQPLWALEADATPKISHTKGTVACVFVQDCEIDSHPVNLPVSEMDIWIPG